MCAPRRCRAAWRYLQKMTHASDEQLRGRAMTAAHLVRWFRTRPVVQSPCRPVGASAEPLESRRLLSATVSAGLGDPVVAPPAVYAVPPAAPGSGVESHGVTLHEQAGKEFTAEVGSFVFPAPGNGLGASIDWGDGATSAGTLKADGPVGVDQINYDVIGTHTYAKPGTYAIRVTVTRQLGPPGSMAPIQLITTIDSKAIVGPGSTTSLQGSVSGMYKVRRGLPDTEATYVFRGSGNVSPL